MFRHDGKAMRLIGQDKSTYMRNSGETTLDSINYLTGKRKRINGMLMDGEIDLTPHLGRAPDAAPRQLERLLAPELE